MTDHTIPLAIFGARSFTAGELLRLLATHQKIAPGYLVSRSLEGAGLDQLQPHVARSFADADLRAGSEEGAYAWLADHPQAAVALCVGSGESAPIVAELAKRDLLKDRVLVDLSGDFRLPDAESYKEWYGRDHACPELLSAFDYCIPELHRADCKGKLISNPGCFASAVQLACAPAVKSNAIAPDIHVFGMTGSSGSGASVKPNTHHPTRAHEVYAYRPLIHQHTPEILRGLGMKIADDLARFSFIPHSVPLVRGISVCASFTLKDANQADALRTAYAELAAAEPMLELKDDTPKLTGIIGTNIARLSISIEGTRAVAFCAIDNLCRGASGQALQNLNRALGLPETLGLEAPGMAPI